MVGVRKQLFGWMEGEEGWALLVGFVWFFLCLSAAGACKERNGAWRQLVMECHSVCGC
jgi:hypothetical protein